MNLEFTPKEVSRLSATGDINRFDGLNVLVNLNDKLYAGVLDTKFDGTAIVNFKDGNDYYAMLSYEIASPYNRGYVAEVVDGLSISIG